MKTLKDLQRIEKRPKGMSDHDYVELYRPNGPAVDRYGFLWTFSLADLLAATDPRMTAQLETEKLQALGVTEGPLWDYFAHSLLFANGEAHRRRRAPLAPGFAFPLMEAMRAEIRAAAEDLIRPCLGREVDFLAEIAGPLPARIVAGILGVPVEEVPRFTQWVYGAMAALSLREADLTEAGVADLAALGAYVEGLLEARRRAPGDDFLSTYLARAGEEGLGEIEIRTQITAVILAGADTTRMALASTIAQLQMHPDQWAAFCADPEALNTSVAAEGLRHDPPIGSLPRVAIADLVLGGASIPAGTVIAPIVLAALRDPAVYAEPAAFNIHRADHPRHHPVFGAGAHRCLGEALARAELEEALAVLATLAPRLSLVGDPPRLHGLSGPRGIDQMRVQLRH